MDRNWPAGDGQADGRQADDSGATRSRRRVANVVIEEVIRPADPRYLDYPPLPYEEAIDRDLSPRQKRGGRR